MLSEKERLEIKILSIIHSGVDPVGSGNISEQLRLAGFEISEATVGRILRSLDHQGFTARVGFQGRLLTSEGLQRLTHLRKKKDQHYYSTELMSALKSTSKENLLDLLVARRAIEGEIARLAAIHATPEQVKLMLKVIEKQKRHDELGIAGAHEDVQFHQLIAQAAGNKVLEAALALIRQYGQLSPILELIRKEVRSYVVVDHERILQAIQEHEPEAAGKAMVEHLESLINDVEEYWRQQHNLEKHK
ncbi:MAG: FCD domain-containing protein [Carboxydocellales bacterium]